MVREARRLEKLEALRGVAALYVFAHHYALEFRWNQYHLGSYATVAVMMFFLLSGFVIYRSSGASTDTFSLPTYARKRALRILPAYLVALLLSYFADRLISGSPFDVPGFLGNMAFLVDSRFVHGVAAFHGNVPLWSLSYEVWFYVFFAVAVLAFGRRFEVLRRFALGITILGLVSVWLVPNPISQYASAFVIWWAGAELAREYDDTGRISWRGQMRSLATMTCIGVLVAVRIALVHGGEVRADRYQRTQLSHLIITVLIIAVGLIWSSARMWGFGVFLGPFRWFAPLSYGIYIFHYPVILFASSERVTGSSVLDLLWVVPTVLALAWVFDRQLHVWLSRRLVRSHAHE